jgi:hypothetical protein
MHVELLVPGFLAAAGKGRYAGAELLLARARRRVVQEASPEERLLALFGVEGGKVPAGALAAHAAGREAGDWLRADPVHLRLMRDHLVVVPAEAFDVTHEEAEALAGAVNAHFAGRIEVNVCDARRWLARVDGATEISGHAALQEAGREVKSGDPLLNELQMLLHAHPANAAREARGEPAINSLWLWGAGPLPEARAKWTSVVADEPEALGLARLAGARYGTLPDSATAWLERAPLEGRHLVMLGSLRAAAALGDAEAFQRHLRAVEEAWFAPLLVALRSGRVGMVSVHAPESGLAFEITRGDLRRFWNRPRPLASFA